MLTKKKNFKHMHDDVSRKECFPHYQKGIQGFAIYEGMTRAPNFEKGYFRDSK